LDVNNLVIVVGNKEGFHRGDLQKLVTHEIIGVSQILYFGVEVFSEGFFRLRGFWLSF
jgi:hypothetical protein